VRDTRFHTIPGYLPQRNDRQMAELFGGNVEALFGAGSFEIGGHRTGSTDMGDIAHMKPVIHPYLASALGKTHGADFRISEPDHAYLTPAKLLAMTAIDLLYGDAAPATHRVCLPSRPGSPQPGGDRNGVAFVAHSYSGPVITFTRTRSG
jgi:hypothetical protein